MDSKSGFPATVILDGPTFSDELKWPPQDLRETHDVESLRLVPAKSAATGVNSIYFVPGHRQWALVRLARRYRWILEIQMNRGLSGEQQLSRQGFAREDLAFLFDIVPAPPDEYNPVVYDMLWLVATFEEYLSLTRAMLESTVFTPRELIGRTPDVDATDAGYFTRFLRSHLIRPRVDGPDSTHRRSNPERGDLRVTLDRTYEVTPEGEGALRGIVSEYDRIFERGAFDPLLITRDHDPVAHLREFEADDGAAAPDVSADAPRTGVVDDVARSFAEMPSADGTRSRSDAGATAVPSSDGTDDSPTPPTPDERPADSVRSDASDAEYASGPTETPETGPFGEFTRAEVLDATVAAASLIESTSVVRTARVKEATWEAVAVDDRNASDLWESVRGALSAMDRVQARPDGRVWVALPSE